MKEKVFPGRGIIMDLGSIFRSTGTLGFQHHCTLNSF